MDDLNKNKFNNRCVTVNVKVNLENVYQKDIKLAEIEIDEICSHCDGYGVVKTNDFNKNKNKNSRNRNRKKNFSKKKNEMVYTDKKICAKCNGLTKIKKLRKYIIDTSIDNICYLNEYFIDNEEGWYDLVFNINTKEHQFYRKDPKSRYDLILDKEINLYEYYYGGNLTLPFLDGKFKSFLEWYK